MGKRYQKIFAGYYDGFMRPFEKELFAARKELLEPLKGKILEVGAGTGVNFQFYSNDVELIVIDPSIYMLDKAKEKMPDNNNFTLYNYGVHDPELDEIIQAHSLDAIVCTLVLCTIPDPELALKDFKKWLKPDGKLIIMEHIRSKNPFKGKIQDVFNPVWKKIGDGCNLNRNTDEMLKNAGFISDNSSYFKRTLTFYTGVFRIKKK